MTETTNDIATSRLWLLLTAFLYAIFTLMADSHSLMVQWPWVAIYSVRFYGYYPKFGTIKA
jgi:hypothetical protein